MGILIKNIEMPNACYECALKDCGYVPSFDGYTYFNYCPNCGADMRGGNNDGR